MDQQNSDRDLGIVTSPPAGADVRPDTDLRLQLPPAPQRSGPHGVADDNLTGAHAQRYEDDQLNADMEAINRLSAAEKGTVPPGPINSAATALMKFHPFSAAMDLARGLSVDPPRAALKGVRDMAQEVLNSVYDLNEYVGQKLTQISGVPDLVGPVAKGAGLAPDKVQLPDIAPPPTNTGKMIQKTTQFLSGLATLNLMPGVSGLAKAAEGLGAAGKAGAAAAKGGLVDFAAMDPHETGLTELLKSYPPLEKNVVLNYLASSPSDSNAEKRLKNGIKGLLGGVVAEGLIHGLKAMRAAWITRQLDAMTKLGPDPEHMGPRLPPPALEGDIADAQIRTALGDPTEKLFTKVQRKLADATEAAEGATPQGVRKAAQNVDQDVFINWSRIDSRNDVKKLIQSLADDMKEEIGDAARGVRSWAKTRLASEQKNAFDLLINRAPAGTFNAEQTVAVRKLWVSSAEKLSEVSNIAVGAPSEANLFAFRKQLATHYFIQQEVLAARTEAGRALNAWAIPAGSSASRLRQMEAIIDGAGGTDFNRDLARRIASLADPRHAVALEKLVEKTTWAKSMDVLQSAYMNAILSSPATHAVIQASSLITAYSQIAERGMAAQIGRMIGTQNGVEVGEALAMMHGQIEGFKDAMRALRQTTGEAITAINPVADSAASNLSDLSRAASALTEDATGVLRLRGPVEHHLGALSPEVWQVARETPIGQALNLMDTAMNVPGRFIQLGHEIHKMAGYRMELHAQAVRQAAQEIRAGSLAVADMEKRVADIVLNPPDRIKLAAVDQALYQTFTQKPNEVMNALGRWTQNLTCCGVPVGRLLMPFKNTPINIVNYALERTPMAPFTQAFKADIAAGGARADLAITRVATGTVTMMAMMDLALSGKITGQGPADPLERANLVRTGWQPYSIKVGNKYVSYGRLHPVGLTMGMAADIAEISANAATSDTIEKNIEKALLAATFSVANVAVHASYLRGVSDFTAAIHDSDQAAERWAKNLAGSIVPAGIANLATQMDPYVKTTNTMFDAIKARVPYWNSTLAPYRDLWGRKRDYRSLGMPIYDVVIPSHLSVDHPEPIDKELQKLEYYPSMPPREQVFHMMGTLTEAPIDLEKYPKAYSEFVRLSGNGLKDSLHNNMGCLDYLNAVVTGASDRSQNYKMLSSDPSLGVTGRAGFIQNTINYYRDKAMSKLLDDFPALRVEYEQNKRPVRTLSKFDPSVFGGQYPGQ